MHRLTSLVAATVLVSLIPLQSLANQSEPGMQTWPQIVWEVRLSDGSVLEVLVFRASLDSSQYPAPSVTFTPKVSVELADGTRRALTPVNPVPMELSNGEEKAWDTSYWAADMYGCAVSPEIDGRCWLRMELVVADVGLGGDTSKIGTVAGWFNFTSFTRINTIQPPTNGCGVTFLDVQCDNPAYDAINELVAKNVTTGCQTTPDPLFCPNRFVTRGEMAAFVARAMELASLSSDTFCDDNGHFAEGQIEAIAAIGVAQGIGGCDYGPDQAIPRWQMALFLSRALNLEAPTLPYSTFSDISGLSLEAQDAIEAIAAAGITQGTSPGIFDPFGAVTRWQMALFLSRTF